MTNYIILKTRETKTIVASLCDDGIIRVMLKKKSEINSKDTEDNISAYIEISGGKKYGFLIYSEDGTVVYTDDARKKAKELESKFGKTCMAVLVNTLAHKLIANFYLNFYKPDFPFKVFNKMEDAEAWCIEQNQKQTPDALKTLMF
ncbi:MAG: hypothetical protein V4677_01970 [Bacteroidota bacterium]